jgi:hypothetical protein
MMGGLFSAVLEEQMVWNEAASSRLSALQCQEHLWDMRCLKNFRDFHGYDPDPAMNMFVIRRDYGMPWRKSPIPKVSRKASK